MNRFVKRLTAAVLAGALCLSLAVPAFAAESDLARLTGTYKLSTVIDFRTTAQLTTLRDRYLIK